MQVFSFTHRFRRTHSTGTYSRNTHQSLNLNCKRSLSWQTRVSGVFEMCVSLRKSIMSTLSGSPWHFNQTCCSVRMLTKSVLWSQAEMLKIYRHTPWIYLQKPNKLTQQATLCNAWKKDKLLCYLFSAIIQQSLITVRINKANLKLCKHSHVWLQCGLL